MAIIDDYVKLKAKHSKFFRLSPKDRLKSKEEIFSIKKEIDLLELKIIKRILNYFDDYNRIYNALKNSQYHHFLDSSSEISTFLSNQKISEDIGYSEKDRNDIFLEFRKMCNEVWRDHIISSQERKGLDKFCRFNLIDKTQQYIIEQEIQASFNDGFDLNKTVEHYFKEENKSAEEIQKILKKEYQKDIILKKISSLISDINYQLSTIGNKDASDNVLKNTFHLGRDTIYVFMVKGALQTSYDFENGYEGKEKNSWIIMISKERYENSNDTRLTDIVTDAICYKINSSHNNLQEFLEKKVLVRKAIEEQWI